MEDIAFLIFATLWGVGAGYAIFHNNLSTTHNYTYTLYNQSYVHGLLSSNWNYYYYNATLKNYDVEKGSNPLINKSQTIKISKCVSKDNYSRLC